LTFRLFSGIIRLLEKILLNIQEDFFVAQLSHLMKLTFTIGRHQLVVQWDHKRGRPKNTSFYRFEQFGLYLKRVATGKRFAGHPASRVLRRVFEKKAIKKALGLNLTALVLLTGLVTPAQSALQTNPEAEIILMATETDKVTVATQESVRNPLDNFNLSQGYHVFHRALDFKETAGAPIYPIMDGVVEAVFNTRFGYGKHVIVNHDSNYKSLYAHMSKITVQKDQTVDQHTVIGLVGSTGLSTGSHLHLEVWENGRPINPLAILK